MRTGIAPFLEMEVLRRVVAGLQIFLFVFVLLLAALPDLHHGFLGHAHGHGDCSHQGESQNTDDHCVVELLIRGALEPPSGSVEAVFVAHIGRFAVLCGLEREGSAEEATVFARGPPQA